MSVICFDLWNTLIKSPLNINYEDILVEVGVNQMEIYPFVRDYIMNKPIASYAQIANLITKKFGINQDVAKLVVEIWEQDNLNARWITQAQDTLMSVSPGNQLVLISNVSQMGWCQVEEKMKIADRFVRIFLSWKECKCKPDPTIWAEVMNSFPKEVDFWMVGDSLQDDIVIPKQLGWKTIQVGRQGVSIDQVPFILKGGV